MREGDSCTSGIEGPEKSVLHCCASSLLFFYLQWGPLGLNILQGTQG